MMLEQASAAVPGPGARWTTRQVLNGSTCIQYRALGEGERIVLLPSLGRDGEDFEPIAELLAVRGFRALLPSPRGIGGSSGPLADLTLHDFAQDVAAVLTADGAKSALFAGHAFGNWVARVMAVDFPERVRGIAVLAAAHRDFPAELRGQIDVCMNPDLPAAERLAALQAVFFAPGHDASAWLQGWHPVVAKAQRRASANTPTETWWQAGSVPVLDVQAECDVFAPASGMYQLRDTLGADRVTIQRIPHAGHALLPEQPTAVAEALADFAARI